MPPQRTNALSRAPIWLGALTAIAITAVGCSDTDVGADQADPGATNETTDSVDGSGAGATTATPEAGPNGNLLTAATFDGQATTIQGETFDLAGLANKDLVIWFWAPW